MNRKAMDANHPEVAERLRQFEADARPYLAGLDPAERRELLSELADHVLESAAHRPGEPGERVAAALRDLGPPEDFLPEMAEEVAMSRRARAGSPLAVAALIGRNLGRGVLLSALLSLGAIAIIAALVLAVGAVAAAVIPGAGLYWTSFADWSLSVHAQAHPHKVPDAVFVPAGLVAAAALYFATTRAMVAAVRRLTR